MLNLIKNKKLLFLIGILLLIAVFLIGFKYYYSQTLSYSIPGVPYCGIYNVTTTVGYVWKTSPAMLCEMASILGYWHNLDSSLPNPTLEELDKKKVEVVGPGKEIRLSDLKKIFEAYGYAANIHQVSKLDDFKNYINSNKRAPVIFPQMISKDNLPSERFSSLRVAIGFSALKKTITVHDYYLGANYEIPWKDFKEMWLWGEGVSPKYPKNFLIVYPKNYPDILEKTKNIKISSPERTDRMDKVSSLLIKSYEALTFFKLGNLPAALNKWQQVINNPTFTLMYVLFQIEDVYCTNASVYVRLGDFDKALEFINRASELNHDLDKSTNGWPAYRKARVSCPLEILGDMYLAQGQKDKALDAYRQGLAIEPDSQHLHWFSQPDEITLFDKEKKLSTEINAQ